MNLPGHSSKRTSSLAIVSVLFFAAIVTATARISFAATSSSGVVIPLYTYPTDGSWSASLQAKKAHPNVPIIAVINPGDGPGGSSDSNYVQGVKNFQAAGIIVIGYVATGYASHGMSDLDTQISLYKSWYSANGIFFDEMSNNAGNENYYSTLNTYVKSLGMTMTMGNPGTSVPNSYIGTLDSLCIFEQGGLPTLSYLSSYSGHPKSNFAYIGLSVSSLNTSYEASSSNYVQWIYITDAGGGNPYNVLPSYFMNEVAALDAGGQTSTSTSTATSKTTTTTTTTATGTAATLSISTVDSSNQPISGFYIQEIKDNTAGSSTGGTYTPQTVTAVVGHSYSVTVDDYATRYVEGSNIGTFARNAVIPQSGTSTFTLQGVTNLVFTEALLATSSSTSTTTTASRTSTTTSTRTATSTTSPRTTTASMTASPTSTSIATTSTTTQTVATPVQIGTATLYQDTFKVIDLFGLPISGASVKVTAANGTQITKTTDSNGVASLDLPNGTYSAAVSYMGDTATVADQSPGAHTITVTFILSFPILVVAGLFAGTLAAVVVGRRLHRGKVDLSPTTF